MELESGWKSIIKGKHETCFVLANGLKRHKHKNVKPSVETQAKSQGKSGFGLTDCNRLFAEYGTNFPYIGEVKNGLDRVTVVTSIPIPRYTDIRITPIKF